MMEALALQDNEVSEKKPFDEPILRIHFGWDYFIADVPLDELIEITKAYENDTFIVLSESPFCFRKFKASDTFVLLREYEPEHLPTFLSDLMTGSAATTVCGEACTVTEVVCFRGLTSGLGNVVYLCTDVGTFVRYYSDEGADAIEFTEAEFREAVAAYAATLPRYTVDNYVPSISGNGNGGTAFLDFVAKREAQTRLLNTTLTVAVPIVAAAALVTVPLVIVKRRRANANR